MHLRTDTSANAHFASVPTISRPRNSFSVAEKHVTTIQFDKLFPVANKMIYPGDTLSVAHQSMARLQTQITTLYDDLYFDVHAWFVPLRLIQKNWSRFQFNTQEVLNQDNSALTTPKILIADPDPGPATQFAEKSLYDYFGYPTKVSLDPREHIQNYYARAYNLIWNENYRDQNLQQPAHLDLNEGPDDPANYVLRHRGKRHDKFTSCLPWQQKGTPLPLPIGQFAPVVSTNENILFKDNSLSGGNSTFEISSMTGDVTQNVQVSPGLGSSNPIQFGPNTGLIVDLAQGLGASVNAWRQSIAVQHLLEADARGGTRDVESIKNRWGVTVPDFRIQRPEYLGGQTWSFDGHVVPQTSATTEDGTPQANLTQFSQALNTFNVNHSFVEHGVFMILLSARSNITYQQGLDRTLSYKTRYDFYQPEFAQLGEVAVKNSEIRFMGLDYDVNKDTFGYQEYGYELRYGENRVSAEMRSNSANTLDSKHMADYYVGLPTLSGAWIESNTPIARNIAVSPSLADPIELNMMLQGKIARTLPMYSIPGLLRL